MKTIIKLTLAFFYIIKTSTLLGQEVPVKADVTKDKVELSFSLPKDVSYAVSQRQGSTTITIGTKDKIDPDAINKQLNGSATVDNIIEKNNSVIIKLSNPGWKVEKHQRENFGILITYTPNGKTVDKAAPDKSDAKTESSAAAPAAPPVEKKPGTLRISNDNEEVKMTFEFDTPVGMAGFLRDGYYWLVFDTDKPLVMKGVFPEAFGKLEQKIDPPFAVFELKRNPNVTAHVFQEENKWIVLVNDKEEMNQGRDRKDILGSLRQSTDNKSSYVIDVPGNGRYFSFQDPRRGDFIHIFANTEFGRKVENAARLTDFTMEESLQGLAITTLVNDLKLTPDNAQIIVSRDTPLDISSTKDRALAIDKHRKAFYLDMSKWSIGKSDDFTHKEILEQNLADASPNQRVKAYYDLAQFYLMNNYAAEALGILRLIGDDVPGLIHEAKYVALRAIASYLIGDYEEAYHDLNSPEILPLKDGDLWRGLSINGMERYDEGIKMVMAHKKQLFSLPSSIKIKALIRTAKAALKVEKLEIVEEITAEIDVTKIDIEDKSDFLLISSQLNKAQNRPKEADADFRKIMEGQDPKAKIEARLSELQDKIKAQSISLEDAIDQLEVLRYQWRGNKDELFVLRTLSDLYIKNHDYKNALKILSLAVKYFPKSPKSPELKKKMASTFLEIFSDANSSVNPITAIALYDDFSDLNPDGIAGDSVVLKVAEKLNMLEFQAKAMDILKKRFEGAKNFNETLALAYLNSLMVSKNNEESIKLIDGLLKRNISEDTKKQLVYSKIKILSSTKKYPEALALLNNDKSNDSLKIRAAIYWLMGDWKNVADNLILYIQSQKEKPDPSIILTYVIALHEDKQFTKLPNIGLEYGKFMDGTPYEKYFKVLTSNNFSQEVSLDDRTEHLSQVDDFAKLLEVGK